MDFESTLVAVVLTSIVFFIYLGLIALYGKLGRFS
jgi:hypothetical protein